MRCNMADLAPTPAGKQSSINIVDESGVVLLGLGSSWQLSHAELSTPPTGDGDEKVRF